MRKYLNIMLLIWLVSAIACDSNEPCPQQPEALISAYQDYVAELKNTDRFYSSKQWKEKESKHIQLMETCYPDLESEMSPAQEEELWSSVIEYYLFRHKGGIEIIFDTSIPRYALLQEKIKTIWPDPYVAFEKVFSQATDLDFKRVLDEMRKETAE